MKGHILAGLREQVDRWEALLAVLSEAQITAPRPPSEWSLKDEMAHLWAWQQRSIARLEAAQAGRAPQMPEWLPGVDPGDEGVTDQVNAWIYEANRRRPWSEVRRDWRHGYGRMIGLAEAFEERDLLDAGRYEWLQGYSLAMVLLASYDHHQEHLDKALEWQRRAADAEG